MLWYTGLLDMKAKKTYLILSKEDSTGESLSFFRAYLFDLAGASEEETSEDWDVAGKGSEVKCFYFETLCEDVLHHNVC